MSQKFKLVKLNAKPGQPEKGQKYFAISVSTGVTKLEGLCELISARSTVSSADVKAVLDSLNFVVDHELRAGRIVRIGELGSMRVSFGSEGVEEEKSFSTQMIRKPRIVFSPGEVLNNTRKLLTFSKLAKAKEEEAVKPEEDEIKKPEPGTGEEEGAEGKNF